MLARNTILQSRYRIVRPLGKGGMGQVYEAIDDTVDSIVAIKETFANTDKLRNAFEREAKLLASLRHPVLPRVMHHFVHSDQQFLVMDFVEGLNLAQLLDLRGLPFRYEAVLPWTDKLLGALTYLHGQREPIIHRDIKPANIKVTNEGDIYLLDFGLAKGAPGQETSSVHGYTAAYAPLEQLNNSGTNAQSDLYSLGATLYHLLTGNLPVSASKRDEIIEEGNRDPLIPAHQSNPDVPEPLSVIISQAMAMKRRDRFVSATEMRVVLREAALTIEREREQKILETPTRLTDEAARAEEHKLVLQETEAAADLGDQRMVNPVVPWKDLGREDVYQKTIGQIAPPVVPPPPPSDPAQRSWPSQIESEPAPAITPDEKKHTEGEHLRKEAEKKRETRFSFQFRWGRFALIFASLLVMVTSIIVWQGLSTRSTNMTASAPNRTSNRSATTEMSNVGGPISTSSAPVPEGMVYVPGGEFTMGRDNGDEYERPAHKVTVQPFFIDQYEVTNEDYAKFVKGAGHRAPSNWVNGNYPAGAARKPVTGVTWDDATAYAKWAGKRLPTEEEYEFAARGTDGRLYPWGNDWSAGLANANGANQSMADVGSYKGVSEFGAYDMVGNAWEWTASDFKPYSGGRLPANKATGESKVIRGGSYESTKEYATTTYRAGWPARGAKTYDQTGFRCVRDVAQ